MNEQETRIRNFYQQLERGIGELTAFDQEELYRPCAVACVRDTVLPVMRRQFEECGCDLDKQYTRYGRSEFFFADIIEPHHIYEMGYPRCFCPVVEAQLCTSPSHCECSRQSILYILSALLPDKQIEVEPMHTVLSGGHECRFRVTVE